MVAASDAPIVPQRVVLVLPSTGEFDSRTYRIATTLRARGHSVIVVARQKDGTPADEIHPAGYRILRVRVDAVDGVPFRGLLSLGARALRGNSEPAPRAASRPVREPATGTASQEAGVDLEDPSITKPGADRTPLLRQVFKAFVRRFAIPLTVRAHRRAATDVTPPADLYHGMAYMGIPVALTLGRRDHAPVVYDARDIYLEARSLARTRGLARWLFAAAERRWARQASRVITVNEDYAEQMERRLRVARPLVVMNCSYRFEPPEPRERRFHASLGLSPDMHIVLYHGGLFPERGIEQLMVAIRDVPGAVLVLMGYGSLEAHLRVEAADPRFGGRVLLAPPVRPDELHDWIACADVVAMPIQPSTLNHRLTTPNKLFEAMAAGVAVVASDLPGMSRIVHETGCGILCDGTDPAAVAAALREVLGDPARRLDMGQRGLDAARASYNWERQAQVLLDEYSRLTGSRW